MIDTCVSLATHFVYPKRHQIMLCRTSSCCAVVGQMGPDDLRQLALGQLLAQQRQASESIYSILISILSADGP